MQAVKSENTEPELAVRRLAHGMGYRFRLHRKDLPGKPDLVFPSRRKVIFVHGCFWHGHDCARGARVPVQNMAYWTKKDCGEQGPGQGRAGSIDGGRVGSGCVMGMRDQGSGSDVQPNPNVLGQGGMLNSGYTARPSSP